MDFNLTLIGQTIAMIVFVWFCMKYIWPLIMGAIEKRANGDRGRHRRRREGPERARATAKAEADKIIAAARDQARGIVDQANTRATRHRRAGEGRRRSRAQAPGRSGARRDRRRDQPRARRAARPGRAHRRRRRREGARRARSTPNAHRDLARQAGERAVDRWPTRSTIARPYAKAVFDLANGERKLAGVVGSARRSGRRAGGRERASARSRTRRSTSGERADLVGVDGWRDQGRASCSRRRRQEPAALLAENDRLTVLPEIAAQFDALEGRGREQGEGRGDVGHAVDARDRGADQAALEQAARARSGAHAAVDASLIGGAIIRADDMVIDGSVRTRFERLDRDSSAD